MLSQGYLFPLQSVIIEAELTLPVSRAVVNGPQAVEDFSFSFALVSHITMASTSPPFLCSWVARSIQRTSHISHLRGGYCQPVLCPQLAPCSLISDVQCSFIRPGNFNFLHRMDFYQFIAISIVPRPLSGPDNNDIFQLTIYKHL